MQAELLPDFLHLYHSFGPRRAVLKALFDHFEGNPSRIRAATSSELKAAGFSDDITAKTRASQQTQVAADLAWGAASANRLVVFDEPDYPALLGQITDFPLLLYASGDLSLLQNPQVAIVGSRNCTPGGAQTAFDFAAQLTDCGLTITSGMALGIDSQAHRGALAKGKTIAVAGTGLDIIYPSRNRKLAAEILEQGLLISEFALGTTALPANFPQRNRIISGLAVATLVVEAAQRSGSLITARLAAEQGREVFAVPGSIHNPQTRGCHQLIRDGAKLVETSQDIATELASLLGFILEQHQASNSRRQPALDREQKCLLDAIGFDPVTSDEIVERSGLTIDKVSSMLLLLELNDLIQSAPGGCFVRI